MDLTHAELIPLVRDPLPGALVRTSRQVAWAKELADIAASAVYVNSDRDSDSDSDDDTIELTTLEDVAENLKVDVQCLVELGAGYEDPICDHFTEEPATVSNACETWDPSKYLASRIRQHYPGIEDDLSAALGISNWRRLDRLCATKERNSRNPDQATTETTAAINKASTLPTSRFQDSGLGTSISTPTSYADTIFSYHGSKGGSIRIPKLNEEALAGQAFDCDVCGVKLKITNTYVWKYVNSQCTALGFQLTSV